MILPYGREKLETVGVQQMISMIHGLGKSSGWFAFQDLPGTV